MNDKGYPIDFVITWVDGSDPKWLADRARYASKNDVIDESRYRDWGLLRYWFRAVEKNAPWVRRIHFVTYGHIPEWLNLNHPKLHIVKHEDFIDKKYLPTFNSCAIELNLYKIPELAEHFVYFNDDMFLNREVKPSFFFKNGLPRDSFVLKPTYPIDETACKIQNNCMQVINKYFKKDNLNKAKLFSLKNGFFLINNIIQYAYPWIIGINSKHLPQGYTKDVFEDIWKREGHRMANVSSHKFRTSEDCSQWLFQYWQLASGQFEPSKMSHGGCYYVFDLDSTKRIIDDISMSKHALICINDNENTQNFEKCSVAISEAFEKKYCRVSCYEK